MAIFYSKSCGLALDPKPSSKVWTTAQNYHVVPNNVRIFQALRIASETISGNPAAMQLRYLQVYANIIYKDTCLLTWVITIQNKSKQIQQNRPFGYEKKHILKNGFLTYERRTKKKIQQCLKDFHYVCFVSDLKLNISWEEFNDNLPCSYRYHA